MCGESTERGTIRKEESEVIQAEGASAWHRSRARSGAQPHERSWAALRPESRGVCGPQVHAQPEYLLVVRNGAVQVADLQMHCADVCLIGKAERRRRDAVWSRGRFHKNTWA